MGIFGRKKKNDGPVWRNAKGVIACPGDSCPQECDDTCPIWMNTMAGKLIQIGQDQKALELYEKIIAMAPDFYDAWNNMGAYYGSKGNYAKARDCYAKAHELKPERPAPVYGLALTNRDLGDYQESLKWCSLYDRMVGDHQLDSVRRTCETNLNQDSSSNQSDNDGKPSGTHSCTKIFMELLQYGQENDLLPALNGFPNIPEILVMGPQFCQQLMTGFSKLMAQGASGATLDAMMTWAVIGGIGAVVEWDKNWPALKNKGLYNTLTEPRGLDCMDEYVLEQLGIKVDTKQYKDLTNHFRVAGIYAFSKTDDYTYSNPGEQIFECLQALYMFGMVYRMCQMGMK